MMTKATQRTRPWRHGFAAVLWFWLVLPSARAVVKVHESLEYYDVPAGAGLDLRMQMRQASPISRRGQVYFGNTEWHVEPNFGYQEYQGLCRISQVQVDLNIKIVLPKLDDDGSATPLDKTRFQQFSQALMQHEQGHKALGPNENGAENGRQDNDTKGRPKTDPPADLNEQGDLQNRNCYKN